MRYIKSFKVYENRHWGLPDDMWDICQEWPDEILSGLLGEDEDGNEVPYQDIDSLLNQVNDRSGYSRSQWKKFFIKVREEGI